MDNDCDDLIDEDDEDIEDATLWYADDDADGQNMSQIARPDGMLRHDCDDRNDTINPDGEEICDDVDNNCWNHR